MNEPYFTGLISKHPDTKLKKVKRNIAGPVKYLGSQNIHMVIVKQHWKEIEVAIEIL